MSIFGDLFDFDGDGDVDVGEEYIAYNIFEDCTKDDEETEEDDEE